MRMRNQYSLRAFGSGRFLLFETGTPEYVTRDHLPTLITTDGRVYFKIAFAVFSTIN
jgi:hypothetical protein